MEEKHSPKKEVEVVKPERGEVVIERREEEGETKVSVVVDITEKKTEEPQPAEDKADVAPPAEEDRAEEKPAEEDIDQHRPLPTHIAPPESMDRQETEDGEDKVEDAGNKWAAAQQKSRDLPHEEPASEVEARAVENGTDQPRVGLNNNLYDLSKSLLAL